jgi:hypothetical protein
MSLWIVSHELWDRWSRCCRSGSGAFAIRVAGRCRIGIWNQWEYLPQDLGFGSGMTCWRRLRDWNEAGVWQWLHEVLLAELNVA